MTHGAAKEIFKRLIREGMTPHEAEQAFDPEELRAAVREEMESGEQIVHRNTPEDWLSGKALLPVPLEEKSLFELMVDASMEGCDRTAFDQATELWLAGWTSHPGTPTSQVMSWYWRAPSKRPPRPGRLYLSTQQALNALRRQTKP